MEASDPRGDGAPEVAAASDPNTPPARLSRLAKHRDEAVRRAVARNPATPSDDLRSLADERWLDVEANPALPLLILASPGWLGDLGERAHLAMLASDSTPAAWRAQIPPTDAFFHAALRSGRRELLPVFLGAGLSIETSCPGYPGVTPLYTAAVSGHLEIVEWLAAAGASANPSTQVSSTPLQEVSSLGNAAMVALLLRLGADPEFCDENGWRPIDMAFRHGHARVVRLLFEAGSRFGDERENAACRGDIPGLRSLLAARPDSDQARSALCVAALLGHTEAVRVMLDLGVPPSGVQVARLVRLHPLVLAICGGHRDVVDLLLTAGAIPGAPGHRFPGTMLDVDLERALQSAGKAGLEDLVARVRGASGAGR